MILSLKTSAPVHCIVYFNAYTAPGAPRHLKLYLQISGNCEYEIQINIFRFLLNKNLSREKCQTASFMKIFSRSGTIIPPLNRSEGGAALLGIRSWGGGVNFEWNRMCLFYYNRGRGRGGRCPNVNNSYLALYRSALKCCQLFVFLLNVTHAGQESIKFC